MQTTWEAGVFTAVMALLHYLHLLTPPGSVISKLFSVPEESVFHHLKISHWAILLTYLTFNGLSNPQNLFSRSIIVPWTLLVLWYVVPNSRKSPILLKVLRSLLITFAGGWLGFSACNRTPPEASSFLLVLYIAQTLFFLIYPFRKVETDLFNLRSI